MHVIGMHVISMSGQRRRQPRLDLQAVLQQPAAGSVKTRRGKVEVHLGQFGLRPAAHALGKAGDDRPMAKAQRVEQVGGRVGTFGQQLAMVAGGQRGVRIQQGDQIPAAGRGGMIQRSAPVAADGPGLGAQRQQRAHRVCLRVRRLAGQGQRIAAMAVAHPRIGLGGCQQLHDAERTGARRFHQRRAAVAIGHADIGAGSAQRPRDLLVSLGGGGEQGVAMAGVHGVDGSTVLEQ